MIDMQEVLNTIDELENMPTTFDTCMKLASLYIVRDKYKPPLQTVVDTKYDEVKQELSDILPAYKKYCTIKRKFQLHEIPASAVITGIDMVCREIDEFIRTLYSSTDMIEERNALKNTIDRLYNSL